MKTLQLLLVLFITASVQVYGQEAASKLPGDVEAFLSQRFSGWKLAQINPDIHKFLKESVSAEARPDFISGDFDGNGQTDYAVYITHGQTSKRKLSVVALLKNGGKFRPYVLESEDAASENEIYGSYLSRDKKGAKGYNHDTKRAFTYVHDAIFVGFWEKGGTSYVYRNGRFKAIITSD